MSNISKRRREGARNRTFGDHKEFLKRISKSLYYGQLPSLPCLSLPVTEISAELFSEAQRGRSLKRLHMDGAAEITRNACVSPCSLVLAILYLERLKTSNQEYLAKIAPSELFLVSLMVSNKFLHDDGEEDEVFCDEWAASGGVDVTTLKMLEKNFLNAIDWRVYVSEESFEAGLSWLERQVALKQASLRGFFTYADLAATSGDLGFRELFKSISSLCLAMTLSYVTSLLAVVTSTLLISNSLMTTLHQESRAVSQSVDSTSELLTPLDSTDLRLNATVNIIPDSSDLDVTLTSLEKIMTTQEEINKMSCCTHLFVDHKKYHFNTMDRIRLEAINSKWWHTRAFNWLYQISVIAPLQEWFNKFNQWNNKITIDLLNFTQEDFSITEKCNYKLIQCDAFNENKAKCNNMWLNLGKFNNFLISVADR